MFLCLVFCFLFLSFKQTVLQVAQQDKKQMDQKGENFTNNEERWRNLGNQDNPVLKEAGTKQNFFSMTEKHL